MKDYIFLQKKYLANCYVNRSIVLVKGKGVYLFSQDGKKYLDLMSNYGVNILGYNNPIVTKALTKQLNNLTTLHCSFNNDKRAEASEALIKRCGENHTNVYWSNSGTEAVEAAIKFAILVSKKEKIIVCRSSYHGKTLGALSLTYEKKYREPFEKLLFKVVFVDFNNPGSLEKAIDDNTAAFITEPIQGESGVIIPKDNYLKEVSKICAKKNIIFTLDEIQTGMGRTGSFLSSQESGVCADILCLGKGIAGGIPAGATLISKKVNDSLFKGCHSSTFGGNPLACTGVLATLQALDKRRLNYVKKTGSYFLTALKKIKSPVIKEIRGKGLMIGIQTDEKRDIILKKLQDEGILAIPAGHDVIRFLPPLTISTKDIDFAVERLQKVFNNL